MTAVQTLRGNYDSVEEHGLATQAMGWESDFKQLDLATGTSHLRVAGTADAVLMRVDFSNRMHQRAMPIKGCQTFGVLARPQAPGKIGSRVMESESLIFMDPFSGLDAVVEPGFGAYTFSISDERLRKLAELQQLPDPTTPAAQPGSERTPDPMQLAVIRHSLEQVLRRAERGCTPEEVKILMESELPAMVLRNWFGAIDCPSSRVRNRTRVLRRALEYLDAYTREAVTVEQLCEASASSVSTVERAFQEQFGVSPKRYLLLSRFSGARRALLDRSDTRPISAVANEWGFWHMGKFAADYKKIFGELPSRTRAR